jgi:DNA repair protein RadA/Sms
MALPADAVYFGEISLSGAVRPVSHGPARLKEAQKLGFSRAFMPSAALAKDASGFAGAAGIGQLADLVAAIAAAGTAENRRK